jgi:hypothetical protein
MPEASSTSEHEETWELNFLWLFCHHISSDFLSYRYVRYVAAISKISVITKQSKGKYVSVFIADSTFAHRTHLSRNLKILKYIFSKVVIY